MPIALTIPSLSTESSSHSQILKTTFREPEDSEDSDCSQGSQLYQRMLQAKFIQASSGKDKTPSGGLEGSEVVEGKAAFALGQ